MEIDFNRWFCSEGHGVLRPYVPFSAQLIHCICFPIRPPSPTDTPTGHMGNTPPVLLGLQPTTSSCIAHSCAVCIGQKLVMCSQWRGDPQAKLCTGMT